jgi:hypothetical protein
MEMKGNEQDTGDAVGVIPSVVFLVSASDEPVENKRGARLA